MELKHVKTPSASPKFPKSAFFVLGNEFAERFSFYGMRSLLILYFINVHFMSESTAKLTYHLFVAVSYLTPLLGSLLADGFLGKYKVIFYFSILYMIGHVSMTAGAFFDAQWSIGHFLMKFCDYIGLMLIAVANGGLKPCISAFAGDQFVPEAYQQRKKFFSYFYSSVNYGALLSMVLTPLLFRKVKCFGQESCYPLAFGVPALFMLLAFVFFISGRPFYKITKGRGVLGQVIKCAAYAVYKSTTRSYNSWTSYATKKYDIKLVQDVKNLLHILVLFVPIVPFWALLDQQGSTWLLQANRMSTKIGPLTVLPNQMLMLNPLLIIILVPIFEILIYPCLTQINCLTKPLRRMGWGGVFIGSSFVVSGLLEMIVQKTQVANPSEGTVRYKIFNSANCNLMVNDELNFDNPTILKYYQTTSFDLNSSQPLHANCADDPQQQIQSTSTPRLSFDRSNATTADMKGRFVYVKNSGKNPASLETKMIPFSLSKTTWGRTRIYVNIPDYDDDEMNKTTFNVSVSRPGEKAFFWWTFNASMPYFEIEPYFWDNINRYVINIFECGQGGCGDPLNAPFVPLDGEAKILMILKSNDQRTNGSKPDFRYELIDLIPGNSIPIFWQLPQFFLIAIGEIMFAITGLEFSYSQASVTMKSVLLAIWYVNNAMGDLIAAFISGSSIGNHPIAEFFLYATLVFMGVVGFAFLAIRYTYVEPGVIHVAAENEKTVLNEKELNGTTAKDLHITHM